MAKRHYLCAPKIARYLSPDSVQIFLSILHLTKTYPILAISEKSPIFASFTRKGSFPLSWQARHTPISDGCSWARPPSFPTGQLTFGRLAAGDCGHNLGNALFSSSVRIVFTAWRVLSPSALGAIMALFSRFPFPYDSHPPKFTGFAYADKIHVFRPFRLAALVCRPARCGCLTPYSIAPKRTGEFLIVQASKIGFPQKRLFVSRSRRLLLSVSYLLTF